MQQLSVRVSDTGGIVLVRVAGEVDRSTEPELGLRLSELPARHVAIDLSELEFLSCGGVAILLECHHRTTARGHELVLVSPGWLVTRVLALTGALDHLTLAPSSPAATRALRGCG
ncbi:STAS domain-containing protein [Umezawaea beigongshangensis]|uniref:STAS domain-containing protein n=1 Tax=Umezawaea beigongshangensis TaxID=2780383 RepID=UPI0027DDE2E1|nr:STAS domain-containing protein [Umezawaea beigongshangensis]